MSEYTGYVGKSLEFLKSNNIVVGDSVKILSDLTYSGIVMPRYEHGDDKHIVLKLNSGYNVGLEIDKIKNIEKLLRKNKILKQTHHCQKYFSCPLVEQ
jgi:glutamyl-tRNA(Gln) amidotransferase subunit D